MKPIKRWLSIFFAATIAVFIAFSALSMPASAAAASGTCGDSVVWDLSEDGILTISGSGLMQDYTPANPAPWSDQAATLTNVVFESGVTAIGDCTFSLTIVLAGTPH